MAMMKMTLPVLLHANPSVFTISYIGTLSGSYPVSGFMDAVEKLTRKGYAVKLRFVGSVSSSQRNIIKSKNGTTA